MEKFLNIIITTSITAIIVLAVKAFLKNKISPKWQFAIWLILVVRLLIPIFPESNLSIFNAVPSVKYSKEPSEIVKSKNEIKSADVKTKKYFLDNSTLKFNHGENMDNVTSKTPFHNKIFLLWFTGSMTFILYMLGVYIVYHNKLNKLEILEDDDIISVLEECKKQLNINKHITVRKGGKTPILTGLLRTEIILPEGYTKKEIKSVFMHELVHYKHKDVLWTMLATLLLCIYWYNPIIWYCFSVFRRDVEIFCDYRVLQVYKDKKAYANVLLKTALKKNVYILGTTCMQNGEKEVSKRIKYIAYFKKPKVLWSSIAIIVSIIIAVICLTNPMAKTNNMDKSIDYKEVYKHKTLYVGDVSRVGNMTSNLYYSQYKKGISLETQAKPYAINVHYSLKPENLSQKGAISKTDNMIKNAAIMFCLIDNVDMVNLKFDDGNKVYSISFKREAFNKVLNEDVRKYSKSFNEFKNKFIPLIDKQNWSNLDSISENIAKSSSDDNKLPPFTYEGKDKFENMVYEASMQKYFTLEKQIINSNEKGVTIVAPKVYGTYEDKNNLKIFATVYYSIFKLQDNTLSEYSAGIIPTAIIYNKNSDGSYSLKEYVEAKDGDYFKKSIENFCKPRRDIAKKILEDCGDNKDVIKLMKKNLMNYVEKNGLNHINVDFPNN